MKKLFISVPMRGRTIENIKKSRETMHKIAEIAFGEELEVIDNIIENSDKGSLWCLGDSIQKMQDADYFIGVGYEPFFRGCEIETNVADRYRIRSICLRLHDWDFLEDARQAINNFYSEEKCCVEPTASIR